MTPLCNENRAAYATARLLLSKLKLDTVFGFAQGATDGTIVVTAGSDADAPITAGGNAILLVLGADFATADVLDMIVGAPKTNAAVITEAVAATGNVTLLGNIEKVLIAFDDTALF